MKTAKESLTFGNYRRQVLKRLPDFVEPADNVVLIRCYVQGLDVRGTVLFLT